MTRNSNKDYLLNPTGRAAVAHDIPLANVSKTMPKEQQKQTATPEEKPATPLLIPRFNKVYSTLRENDTLAHIADGWSIGGATANAAAPVLTSVTVNKNTPIRLAQWPGGIQVYLAIIAFSMSGQTSTAGVMQAQFFDPAGSCVVLGTGTTTGGTINAYPRILLPYPVTDMLRDNDQTFSFGSVSTTLYGVTGNYLVNFGITWGYVYILPANESYEVHHVTRDR
jgi:hypothetical protein